MTPMRWRVIDPSGLHARPAARFVKAMHAAGLSGTVTKGDKSANVVSILEILGLGVDAGEVVTLDLNRDADDVLLGLNDLIEPCSDGANVSD